jgi:lipopolysaccharide transport system ATP-binding protein
MSEPIIKVEGLGKKYTISHEKREGYTALRDVISNRVKGLVKGKDSDFLEKEDFWALKNVDFEIKKGDAVGIIGRNGAGKSTLLKILSRITEPTHGRIELNGRIASLLEVGTGFHPELTGRENVYLNGAILGMSRAEIKRKFDEIVDFSGVERFLDTPVKRYSSGMYVRLAFAVAAHLEPEILIVDEVLAVGDAEFQKKCLGKMNDVTRNDGRTVLFVSHNMSAIRSLCTSGILLQNGTVAAIGDMDNVLTEYMAAGIAITDKKFEPINDREMIISNFYTCNVSGEETNSFITSEEINVIIDIEVLSENMQLRVGFDLLNSKLDILFRSFDNDLMPKKRQTGRQKFIGTIPSNLLMEDDYYINLRVGIHGERWIDNGKRNLKIKVEHIDGVNGNYKDFRPGTFMPLVSWSNESK